MPNLPSATAPWRQRILAEETAVALTYDSATFAVMLASPQDLQDFAIGFSISEGIIESLDDITEFTVAVLPTGVECRMRLVPARRAALEQRRRWIAGPGGCGLCGLDSLAQVMRPPAQVTAGLAVRGDEIAAAMARLPALQVLNQQTRATHAAGFFTPCSGEILLREDVGRHNALDKLIGALRRRGDDPAGGVLLLTSRVSVELVQKAAIFGTGIVAAISAPTAQAVRNAEAAGITLLGIVRGSGFEIFTHPRRITGL